MRCDSAPVIRSVHERVRALRRVIAPVAINGVTRTPRLFFPLGSHRCAGQITWAHGLSFSELRREFARLLMFGVLFSVDRFTMILRSVSLYPLAACTFLFHAIPMVIGPPCVAIMCRAPMAGVTYRPFRGLQGCGAGHASEMAASIRSVVERENCARLKHDGTRTGRSSARRSRRADACGGRALQRRADADYRPSTWAVPAKKVFKSCGSAC